MKILHVAETIKGGVATILQELINDQVCNEGKDAVFVLVPKSHSDYIQVENKDNLFFFERTGRNFKSFFHFCMAFIKLIRNNDFDVIHLHSTFAGFLCRLIFFICNVDSKIIYCPHAFSFLMNSNWFLKKMYVLMEVVLQIKTDHIICISNYEKEEALNCGLSERKLVVIYNGISGYPLSVPNLNRFIESNELIVTFVGRFDYQKGVDVLEQSISKLSELTDLRFNYEFNIVGEPVNDAESGNFFSLSSSNKSIVINLLGWKNKTELSEIYSNSHLVVMPSRWEGFGLVAIESFQYGTPVIASNNSSLSEIVHNNVTGFLFETESVDGLYELLLNIDYSKLRELSLKCHKVFLEKFTADKMTEKTRALYKI